MATFRFELDHKPTRNKTYNLYLMVTAAGKRTKKKTGIQLKRIDDFNPQCKGNNWIRANVPDAKVLNEQLRLILEQANETYQELASYGDVSSAKVITTNLTMHISRHAFAHIAQEAGAESSAIKNILGHSNLATTERYMGSFDTSKTDNTLRNLFKKKSAPKQTSQEETDRAMSKEEQVIELLKSMTPEQIMAVISAINK